MIAALMAVAASCGADRVVVKALADHPIVSQPHLATIEKLRRLKPTKSKSRSKMETLVVEVSGYIVAYKLEDDRDIHLVLTDSIGNTMVAESVDPACADDTLRKNLFSVSRGQLLALLPKVPSPKMKHSFPIHVTVTGFLFFDKVHGQAGVAPNGIEIHPILNIERMEP